MIDDDRRLTTVASRIDDVAEHLVRGIPGPTGAPRWIADHRREIRELISRTGWALVRGLDVPNSQVFRQCMDQLRMTVSEHYGDLPRASNSGGPSGVFDVTPFPPEEAILFHNEGSHTPSAPRFVAFYCEEPSAQGGATPLSDGSRVLEQLPSNIRQAFAEKGLLYRRNFFEGFDVSWQDFFGVADRRAVEAICSQSGVDAAWREDGNLTTITRRPAIISHPESGQKIFFNQILLHHGASLDPEIRETFDLMLVNGVLPREVRLGDESVIPDEWVDSILKAHVRSATAFEWRRGDLVIVDNFTVAHARCPYQGTRRHHVILGDVISF